jgi:hypothetical protein
LLALLAALLVEEGSQFTSKHRLIFYTPQSHSVLLDPFCSPRQNRPTFPSNRQLPSIDSQPIDRQLFNPSTDNSDARKSFSSSDSLHCSDPASILPTPCKIAVLPARSQVARWRSTTRRPTIGPTDPANGRRAPSRCRPPCLDPYAADVHLDMVASLAPLGPPPPPRPPGPSSPLPHP